MDNHLAHRVALITGANKGIGLAIARGLGREKITVLIGARQPELGEQAAAELRAQELEAVGIELDVTRPETIAAAAATIEARFGRLDILVNNAGITDLADGPPSAADIVAVQRIMTTNFFGTLQVTSTMLPLLRRSMTGRIVNVSSALGSLALNAPHGSPFGVPAILGYKASKAALNMLTIELARELHATGIKVNAAAPGYIATDLNAHLVSTRPSQTFDQAAAVPVRLALLADDGPTGGFFDANGPVAW